MLECSHSLLFVCPSVYPVCVVWMGVDSVCHILRPDGGAEKREYSGDQIKDERDSSIKVETQKTEEETHSRSGCQRAREGSRQREGERERESGERSLVC